MTAPHVDMLVLAEGTGVWAVRSTSRTVYFLDLDAGLLLRERGPSSMPGPGDGRWVPLVSVEALAYANVGVVRVGDRHRYLFDWDPEGADLGFWIQRTVTSIDYVEGEELADLPASSRDDPL